MGTRPWSTGATGPAQGEGLPPEGSTAASWQGLAGRLQPLLEPACPGIRVDCVFTVVDDVPW